MLDDSQHSAGISTSEISAAILETFHSPAYRPPIAPSVALELHELTRKNDSTFAQLEHLLARDPMLAARVLRVARSSAMAGNATIHSLKDAAVRLGLRNLSDLFLETALSSKVFRARGYEAPMEALLAHSVAVARAARLIAPNVDIDPDKAFLYGLLHDIGFAAAMLVVADKQANKPWTAKDMNNPIAMSRVFEAISEIHAPMSATVAKLWGMSEEMQLALGSHHGTLDGAGLTREAALLIVAESVVSPTPLALETPTSAMVVANAVFGLQLTSAAIEGSLTGMACGA
jgi:putative nucleotidyltransferase with HDIG domain